MVNWLSIQPVTFYSTRNRKKSIVDAGFVSFLSFRQPISTVSLIKLFLRISISLFSFLLNILMNTRKNCLIHKVKKTK